MHNWPSANTRAKSTTAAILIHFAAHARHGGADAREQQEHRSTTHPLSHQHSQASISGTRHHLVGCHWRFGDGHRRRRQQRRGLHGRPERERERSETLPVHCCGQTESCCPLGKRRSAQIVRCTPMSRGSSFTRLVDFFHLRREQNVLQRTVLGRAHSHPRPLNALRYKDHQDHHQKRNLVNVATVIFFFSQELTRSDFWGFRKTHLVELPGAGAWSAMIAARKAGPRKLEMATGVRSTHLVEEG